MSHLQKKKNIIIIEYKSVKYDSSYKFSFDNKFRPVLLARDLYSQYMIYLEDVFFTREEAEKKAEKFTNKARNKAQKVYQERIDKLSNTGACK